MAISLGPSGLQLNDGTHNDYADFAGGGKVLQGVHQYSNTSGTGGGDPTSNSVGMELFSFSFTPVSSSSRIFFIGPTVSVSEHSNAGDWGWISCWRGTTLIGYNTSQNTYGAFASGLYAGNPSLNVSCASWGTSAQTIKIRAGGNGSAYVNHLPNYGASSTYEYYGCSVLEIET